MKHIKISLLTALILAGCEDKTLHIVSDPTSYTNTVGYYTVMRTNYVTVTNHETTPGDLIKWINDYVDESKAATRAYITYMATSNDWPVFAWGMDQLTNMDKDAPGQMRFGKVLYLSTDKGIEAYGLQLKLIKILDHHPAINEVKGLPPIEQ